MTQRQQPTRKKAAKKTAAPQALVGTAPPEYPEDVVSALRLSPVAWYCSCGEAWGGRDMEKTVHVHGAYTPGVHHITGPLFRDTTVEKEIRTEWDAESKLAVRG